MRQKEAVPLLKLAMRDMVDDVRLLAYSIKDNIEGQLNADIKESLSALKYLDGKPASGMERKLAYLYWELVYLELAEGDVLAYLLEQAELYARRYLDALNDASVYLLLGRICLRAGNYDAARTAFEDAKTHGLAASAAAPYKAEAEFCAGNYIDVSRELVHVGEGDRAREPISPVYQYWLGNESTA
jgi:tetratricopeptide (TPR) repeat protein